MAKEKQIKTVDGVLEQVGVKSVREIEESPEDQARLIQMAPRIAPRVLNELLMSIPDLAKAFSATISAMEGIGRSLEETKRLRWDVLRDIAKSGEMSGDQVLEAIRIIQEIEANEGIDWTKVLEKTIVVLGSALTVVLAAVVAILAGGGGRNSRA